MGVTIHGLFRAGVVVPASVVVAPICALAFFLRTNGIGDLSVHGDYAYSVYAAQRDLLTIALERAVDGHPPLYYYLLHFWMLLAGPTEYAVRFPSSVAGVLMVPLVWRLATSLAARGVGTLAAVLIATSPALVQPSRVPRMYIFLALLAVLSVWVLHRAIVSSRWREWAVWGIATLALLYTHYYGVVVVMAEGLYALWIFRSRLHRLKKLMIACIAVGCCYVPWIIFSAAGSATTTARIISNAPWPTTLQGVAEMYWIPLNLGEYQSLDIAQWLALSILAILVATSLGWKHLWRDRNRIGLSLVVLGISLVASLAVFLVIPYAVRPRYLLYCVPFYLLFLAVALGVLRWRLGAVGTLAILVVFGFTLAQLYEIEPNILEPDAIQVNQRLEVAARPGDALILHAYWQAGYLAAHYHGPVLSTHSLREVSIPDVEAILAPYSRVWLSMYRTNERNPDYPVEEWLDRRWALAENTSMGESRLKLYIRPQTDASRDVHAQFSSPAGLPVIELVSIHPPRSGLRAGDPLVVGLQWRAIRPVAERYSAFVQVLDTQGRRLAGADREPLSGTEPTAGWLVGREVDDWIGMLLPVDIPPGEYSVRAGLHPANDPRPLLASLPGADNPVPNVLLSNIKVLPGSFDLQQIAHRRDALLGDQIRLLGYGLDIDTYQVGSTRTVIALTDIPIKVTTRKLYYRPGEVVTLTLYWQTDVRPDRDYTIFAHLVDSIGRPIAQADGPPAGGAYQTSSWSPGVVVIDRRYIRLDPDTPKGEYRLLAGMYRLDTMERLQTSGPGANDGAMDLGSLVIGH